MRRVTARHKWTFVLRPAPDSAAPLTHRRVEVLAAALCDFSPARGESTRSGGGASVRPVATRPAAPDVAVALEGGGRRSLASFRGRPVVIGFVQPYCASCITTLKTLDAVARVHPDGSVISIALNVGVGGPGDLRGFAASVGVTLPLFANDPSLRVANAFGVQELETFVVIDPQGRVAARGVALSEGTVLSAVGQP